MDKSVALRLIQKLEQSGEAGACRLSALVGFDGFVDEVVHVVKKRIDTERYVREETLAGYGARIAQTSGYSSNVEIVSLSKKLGGNGPILANSLLHLGVRTNYCGAIGYPSVNAVFEPMAQRCESVLLLSEPACTDAVEFHDGKIIRCKLSALYSLNWDCVKQRAGLAALQSLLNRCDLICLVNWALLPYAGQIWRGILDEVVPMLTVDTKNKTLFFDLADPASRTEEDFAHVLETIRRFGRCFNVVLGLNLSEAVQVCAALGHTMEKSEDNLPVLCRLIREALQIGTVVIHPVKQACAITEDAYRCQQGPFCAQPKLTTGAGDNFNAGFILGKALGLALDECLMLGVANSGFYVRNARSGRLNEIIAFLKSWVNGRID